MKPVVMTAGKRARAKESPDKLTLKVFFPWYPKSESAEIDLINGEVPRITVRAGPRVTVEIMERTTEKS